MCPGQFDDAVRLDQITDVHNAAAIMRSAAFYGVDCVLISQKGNFGMGPNFARIASGALEYVKIIQFSPQTTFLLHRIPKFCY